MDTAFISGFICGFVVAAALFTLDRWVLPRIVHRFAHVRDR